MGENMTGTVIKGINNIFTISNGKDRYLCRIKGKILSDVQGEYNALAPGDEVLFVDGQIIERLPRRNGLYRWNRKKNKLQAIAANLDQLLLFASIESPPFRPRFIDRVLVLAEQEDLSVKIIVNKCDLRMKPAERERIEVYRNLGYEVLEVSAHSGLNMSELFTACVGKRSVVYGQSGVGKSSCLNTVFPHLDQAVGHITKKYQRGTHTTNFAVLLQGQESQDMQGSEKIELIDTPGIRQIQLAGLDPAHIAYGYREIRPRITQCEFAACTHIHEPGCAVRAAVKLGEIHPDRYKSYCEAVEESIFLERQMGYGSAKGGENG